MRLPRDGSSPRTWGTVQSRRRRDRENRFIPTHVGNSNALVVLFGVPAGSSPRTWGTGGTAGGCSSLSRFIPTHVGNSV